MYRLFWVPGVVDGWLVGKTFLEVLERRRPNANECHLWYMGV